MSDTGTHDLQYFSHCRSEVFPLLPAGFGRLLEVGCGAGATGSAIRSNHAKAWLGGVEIDVTAADKAREYFDEVWQLDIETESLPVRAGSLDVILCLDVLEHLVDPWAVVDRLSLLLKPGGCLIASIPNIRHYKVLAGLVFRGEFQYRDAGILDRTHLRFFVRNTAIELLSRAGLVVDRVNMNGLKPWRLKWVLNKALFGALTDIYAEQYFVRAVKR